MKLEDLHLGMKVRHPQYGIGDVKTITEHTAEIRFVEGQRTVEPQTAGLEPAEPVAQLSGVTVPLTQLLDQAAARALEKVIRDDATSVVAGLAARWHGGRLVMHPADPTIATKEVPLEVFFHKVVMVRNQLRVLEQKINAHETLTDAEKVEMQQYITRSYGSMTTFNLLFREKEEQF